MWTSVPPVPTIYGPSSPNVSKSGSTQVWVLSFKSSLETYATFLSKSE